MATGVEGRQLSYHEILEINSRVAYSFSEFRAPEDSVVDVIVFVSILCQSLLANLFRFHLSPTC